MGASSMIETCYPTPQAVAQDMLQGVVRAICDRPDQSAAQREALSRSVVHTVMAFLPRDPVEIMFAGLIVTHFHLVLHSAHDALRGHPDNERPRAKSDILAAGRAMLGYARELRLAQERPMLEAAPVRDESAAEAEPSPAVSVQPKAQSAQPAGPVAEERKADPPPVRDSQVSVAAMRAMASPAVGPVLGKPSGPVLGLPGAGDPRLADQMAGLRRAADGKEARTARPGDRAGGSSAGSGRR
jgi:hypothetical protein